MKIDRLFLLPLLGMGGSIGFAIPAIAQLNLIPDTAVDRNLGTAIVPVPGLPIDLVTEGTRPQNGQNLFHSFQEFNVQVGRGVYFNNPAGVQNIFSRVTGGNPSNILGTVGVQGNANLFLINPSGIIFGPTAALDVQGAFTATTANAVQLGPAGLFSASAPTTSNLLEINPSAFFFNVIEPQPIVNQSTANRTALGASTNGLQVRDGQNLLLLGGGIEIDGGRLNAWGGRVDLGAVSGTGIITLNADGSLQFSDRVVRGDISLRNNVTVDVRAGNRGNVSVTARNLEILDRSFLLTGISSGLGSTTSQAGDITLNASESIKISGGSGIGNRVQAGSIGNGGNINIIAKSLSLSDRGQLSTSVFGQGNAGNITIQVDDLVSLSGINNAPRLDTGIFSTVQPGAVGNSGGISILAGSFSLTNGAQVLTIVRRSSNGLPSGRGNSGDITINIRENADVSGISIIASAIDTGATGEAGNINIKASNFSISEGATVKSTLDSLANGSAGDIVIYVQSLLMSTKANLETFTAGQGNAGNIFVRATDTIFLTADATMQSSVAQGGTGNGGDINIKTGNLILTKGGQLITALKEPGDDLPAGQGNAGNVNINTSNDVIISGTGGKFNSAILSAVFPEAIGKGGNIDIQASSLFLNNSGLIDSSTLGDGDAGDISIKLSSTLEVKSSSITTKSDRFPSGDITINAKNIFLRGDSDITTDSSANNGGNIILSANSIVALNDSDILAFAKEGAGGNVTLNTRAFFGQNYRPAPFGIDPATLDGNDRVDINATGTVSGIITLPDVRFIQNSLTQLPNTNIDTNKLLAQTCLIRKDQPEGTFYIIGTGGLPNRPNDLALSDYPTNTIQPAPQAKARPWKLGDPIVEPQGFYKLADGRFVMSRECDR
jgi:filamentous hemagglutinin family protein